MVVDSWPLALVDQERKRGKKEMGNQEAHLLDTILEFLVPQLSPKIRKKMEKEINMLLIELGS